MLNATPVLPSGKIGLEIDVKYFHLFNFLSGRDSYKIFSDLDDATDIDTIEMVSDNPQCVSFGLFMIWFSSITINLGPTFLSGALAANADEHINEPSCPLVQGPYRHYILNVLWIMINMLCMLLTMKQLHRLHTEFSNR